MGLMGSVMDRRRIKYYVLAFLIRIPLVAFFAHDWDMYVFTMTARMFLLEGISPYDPVVRDRLIAYIPYFPSQFCWYAYPPLPLLIFSLGYLIYLLFTHVGLRGFFYERFFVGLAISFGDTLLAFYSYKLSQELYNGAVAEKVEKAILFNPFIIFVSSFWGMIDCWSTAFLIASIYYMLRKRYNVSALFYTLSVLTKQLSLLLAPIVLAYVFKKRGVGKTIQYIALATALFLMVSLPFLLEHPKNFIYQIFLFHISRFPQGVSLPAIITLFIASAFFGLNMNSPAFIMISNIIDIVSMALMFTIVVFIALKFLSVDSDEGRAYVLAYFLGMVTILSLNRISNPQYFVYAVALGIIYMQNAGREVVKLVKSLSNTILLITLLMTFGAINYFSYGFYMKFAFFRMMWLLFARKDIIIISPLMAVLSVLLMVSILKLHFVFLKIFSGMGLSLRIDLSHLLGLSKRTPITRLRGTMKQIVVGVGLSKMLVIFILSMSLMVGVNMYTNTATQSHNTLGGGVIHNTTYENQTKRGIVGVFYKWYISVTHDPTIPSGDWEKAKLTPLDGYYDSSIARLRQDIERMRSVGIDFIISDVVSGGVGISEQILDVVSEEGMFFGMFINLTSFLDTDPLIGSVLYVNESSNLTMRYIEFSPTNLGMIETNIGDAINRLVDTDGYLSVNNTTVVIVEGLRRFIPGLTYESRIFLAEHLVDMYKERYGIENESEILRIISNETGWNITTMDDLAYNYYPSNIILFWDEKYVIWTEAFRYCWYSEITKILPNNSIIIVILEDIPYSLIGLEDVLSIGNTLLLPSPRYALSPNKFWEIENMTLRQNASIKVSLAIPNYIADPENKILVNESSFYNECWEYAINNSVNITIIYGWNIYDTGSVIEPTVEFGNYTLDLTGYFVAAFKRNGRCIVSIDKNPNVMGYALNILVETYARRLPNIERK